MSGICSNSRIQTEMDDRGVLAGTATCGLIVEAELIRIRARRSGLPLKYSVLTLTFIPEKGGAYSNLMAGKAGV